MLKNKFVILGISGLVLVVCAILVLNLSRKTNPQGVANQTGKQIQVGNDVCADFPKEWVASIIGKPIVRTEPFSMKGTYSCNYFINETNFVGINVDDLSVETQKKGVVQMGNTVKTDPRIAMEHFVVVKPDGLIDSISLVLTPNRFVTVDRFYGKVFDNEGVIAFTVKIAERIQKGEAYTAGLTSDSNLTPTLTPMPTAKAVVPLPQETDIVNSFFRLINEHKVSDAIGMLASDMAGSDSEKQSWAVTFNAFESVSIKTVESSMPEEWTVNKHTYKVVLDVKMKPESANAQPMPYYGWGNGEFYRWVTLEKIGNLWKIDGISTGP